MDEAVRGKHRCFKLWKAGGSRAAYNAAKHASNRAVHQAKSEAEKVALQKIDCISSCQANATCQLACRGRETCKARCRPTIARKKLGKSIMSVFSMLSSLGILKTCQRKTQLKALGSQLHWR